ncbi:MAG: hypothetical protein LBU91_03165 [Bacteroidales bacterium]|jgi:hypothetical protein|nr:hypothetical protein [Bacteroidales bacterium]
MKKTFFYILSLFVALSMVVVSCGPKDNDDDIASVPAQAVIQGAAVQTCEANVPTVTITAEAEGATSYIWRIGETPIEGATSATLVLAKTDAVATVVAITVAGVNATGTGSFSNPPRRVTFEPCDVPGKATITGEDTIPCYSQGITLTANASGASDYIWYKDDVVVENETEATLTVNVAGAYSVEATNSMGEGERSAVKNIGKKEDCEGREFNVRGIWNVTGTQMNEMYNGGVNPNTPANWEETIIADPDPEFSSFSSVAINFNGSSDREPTSYFIYEDEDGFYFPNMEEVARGPEDQPVCQTLIGQREDGSWVYVTERAGLSLIVTTDGMSFTFSDIETNNGTFTNVGIALYSYEEGDLTVAVSGWEKRTIGDMKFTFKGELPASAVQQARKSGVKRSTSHKFSKDAVVRDIPTDLKIMPLNSLRVKK